MAEDSAAALNDVAHVAHVRGLVSDVARCLCDALQQATSPEQTKHALGVTVRLLVPSPSGAQDALPDNQQQQHVTDADGPAPMLPDVGGLSLHADGKAVSSTSSPPQTQLSRATASSAQHQRHQLQLGKEEGLQQQEGTAVEQLDRAVWLAVESARRWWLPLSGGSADGGGSGGSVGGGGAANAVGLPSLGHLQSDEQLLMLLRNLLLEHYPAIADTLLTSVAPGWLRRASPSDRAALFDPLLQKVPAHRALLAMAGHLSDAGVPGWTPASLDNQRDHDDYNEYDDDGVGMAGTSAAAAADSGGRGGGGVVVTAVAADEAARQLARRFAAPRSRGVAELAEQDYSGGSSSDGSRRAATIAVGGSHSSGGGGGGGADSGSVDGGVGADGGMWAGTVGARGAVDVEDVATALASVPDRSALCRSRSLYPQAFVPHTTACLLEASVATAAAATAAAPAPCSHLPPAPREEASAAGPHAGGAAAAAAAIETQPAPGLQQQQQQRGVPDVDAFAALALAKLCRRGHAHLVASVLASVLLQQQQQREEQQQQRGAAAGEREGDLAATTSGGGATSTSAAAASGAAQAVSRLVARMDDASGMEALLEALLKQLGARAATTAATEAAAKGGGGGGGAATAGASSGGSDHNGRGDGDDALARGRSDAAATLVLCALWLLLPGGLGQRGSVRYLLTDKLLLRRRLPPASVAGLMAYLADQRQQQQQPGSSAGGGGGGSGEQRTGDAGEVGAMAAEEEGQQRQGGSSVGGRGIRDGTMGGTMGGGKGGGGCGTCDVGDPSEELLDTAERIVQVWSDPSFVSGSGVSSQAYVTYALLRALRHVSKPALEICPGLLGGLLGGVSARLESPITPVRRQGMRVARAFSRILDPSKPPLFGEEGPLDWLPEEAWHGSCRALLLPPPPLVHGAKAAAVGGKPAGRGSAAAAQLPVREPAGGRPTAADAPTGEMVVSFDQPGQAGALEDACRSAAATGGGRVTTAMQEGDAVGWERVAAGAAGGWAGVLGEGAEGQEDEEEGDSDDEDDSDAMSLEAYDMDEDEDSGEEDPSLASHGAPMALRDVAALLRKSDEPQGVLTALRALEPMVLAAPDELERLAPEIARALLLTRPPPWAEEEATCERQQPSVQRFRSLVALLVEQPFEAGATLADEFYSPHLDVHQRLMVLDGLASAAREMRTPNLLLNQGGEAAAGGGRGGGGGLGVAPVVAVGKVTRVSARSLDLRRRREAAAAAAADPGYKTGGLGYRAGGGNGPLPHVNRFPEVALRWALALLGRCDRPVQGMDLFGADFLLLGQLLSTLGVFVEATASSRASVPLSAALLELMQAPAVAGHQQPWVRRSALVAASQVLRSLPPAALAGALLADKGSAERHLVSRLEWLQAWAARVAATDTDRHCAMLAAGCAHLQAQLASGARESLSAPDPPPLLAMGGRGRGGGIQVPGIGHMR